MNSLRKTYFDIKNDLRSNRVTLKVFVINYIYNSQFRVLLNHRIGKYFSNSSFFLFKHLGAYYKKELIVKRSCDISYNAVIGKKLTLPHPIGIVIGDKVLIEDNVTIFQQVTLGSHGKKSREKQYPIIRSGAKIYTGAKIIGGVTIGENAIIAANCVVNIDVPPNTVAVGIPCRILNKKE
ncbi:serine O-acetyltransferase [Flavobacteriaceae bacterium MAR_2009_75]|nr:serine O-acetyltransferase [Flavobacteriaceae bacterium MAR_2009_75]